MAADRFSDSDSDQSAKDESLCQHIREVIHFATATQIAAEIERNDPALRPDFVRYAKKQAMAIAPRLNISPSEALNKAMQATYLLYSRAFKKDHRVWLYKSSKSRRPDRTASTGRGKSGKRHSNENNNSGQSDSNPKCIPASCGVVASAGPGITGLPGVIFSEDALHAIRRRRKSLCDPDYVSRRNCSSRSISESELEMCKRVVNAEMALEDVLDSILPDCTHPLTGQQVAPRPSSSNTSSDDNCGDRRRVTYEPIENMEPPEYTDISMDLRLTEDYRLPPMIRVSSGSDLGDTTPRHVTQWLTTPVTSDTSLTGLEFDPCDSPPRKAASVSTENLNTNS